MYHDRPGDGAGVCGFAVPGDESRRFHQSIKNPPHLSNRLFIPHEHLYSSKNLANVVFFNIFSIKRRSAKRAW